MPPDMDRTLLPPNESIKKSYSCQCINLLIWLIKSYHVWPPFHAAYVNEWDTQWGKIHDLRSDKDLRSEKNNKNFVCLDLHFPLSYLVTSQI